MRLNFIVGNRLETLAGELEVTVPAGYRSGRKLRLKGKGLPAAAPGDLYLVLDVVFPPAATAEQKQAYADFGAGTTGSRVLNGTFAPHRAVEAALREFYDMDHAMVFSTGYQANLGIISTIAGKGDYIILDIDSHASIWDGCAMGNAEVVPFKHNDVEALEKRLKRLPADAGKLVVLEGVYSMMGDIAPLAEMIRVSKEAGAMVLVDEAHSMGFIGEHGRGVAEAQGVLDQVDFVIGTFSKSVGTVGGFCVSNHPKFEVMRLVCRPYVFTAALPPSVMASSAVSVRKLMHGKEKREHLWANSKTLHKGLTDLGYVKVVRCGQCKAWAAIEDALKGDEG